MSSTPTLEQVRRRLEATLREDMPEAFHSSALVQYRAVIQVRAALQAIEKKLADVEEGLKGPATVEWEAIAGHPHSEV